MVESLSLAAYWGDRQESSSKCANRAVNVIQRLAGCDQIFEKWYQPGKSRQHALDRRFEPCLDTLQALLERGQSRRDTDSTVIGDLGFRMSLWNGHEDESTASITIHCGAHPAVPNLPTPNNCIIQLPYGDGPNAKRVLKVNKLRQVIGAVVQSWDPDSARVTSYECMERLSQQSWRELVVGWLTYISDRYGPLPALPDEYEVTGIEGLGSLITIKTVDVLSASNSAHVAALNRLSDLLKHAGLLTPTPANRGSRT